MLDDPKNTVVEMLVEVLNISERHTTSGAHASDSSLDEGALGSGASTTSSASIRCGLFDAVY